MPFVHLLNIVPALSSSVCVAMKVK